MREVRYGALEIEENKWLPLNQSRAWILVSKEESLWAVTSCCCCQAEIRDENMKRKGVGEKLSLLANCTTC